MKIMVTAATLTQLRLYSKLSKISQIRNLARSLSKQKRQLFKKRSKWRQSQYKMKTRKLLRQKIK